MLNIRPLDKEYWFVDVNGNVRSTADKVDGITFGTNDTDEVPTIYLVATDEIIDGMLVGEIIEEYQRWDDLELLLDVIG